MARNLREKIIAIVNDSYDLRQESTITKIENLVREELQLKEEERFITYFDLGLIQAASKQFFTNTRLDQEAVGRLAGDQPMLQLYCIMNAVVSHLREKGLLTALVRYKK